MGVNNKPLAILIHNFLDNSSNRKKIDDDYYIKLMFIEHWLNII